jgi:hypothetical protein
MRIGDARVLDRLVRGRAWIALVAVALIGVVFMQVSLLKLNAGISRAVTSADTLERQNATPARVDLRARVGDARRRVRRATGMVMPAAGDVHYIDARRADGRRAAAAIRPPTSAAIARPRRPPPRRRRPQSCGRRDHAATSAATGTAATATAPTTPRRRRPPRRRPRRRRVNAATPTRHDADDVNPATPIRQRRDADTPATPTTSTPATPAATTQPTAPAATPPPRPARRRPAGPGMNLVERRIGLLFGAFLTLLLLAGRAHALDRCRQGLVALGARPPRSRSTSATLPAERGSILDRNGVELAVSEPRRDVSATPYLVKDPVAAARRLAPLLGRPVDGLVRQLARRDTGFVYLARDLPAPRADAVRRLDLARYRARAGPRPRLPAHELASQLLGFVGTDGAGLSGLEYADNDVLAGRDGRRSLVKDALGQSIKVRDTTPRGPARTSSSRSTPRSRRSSSASSGIGQTYRPRGATAIVMNPSTAPCSRWPTGRASTPTTRRPRPRTPPGPRRGLHL